MCDLSNSKELDVKGLLLPGPDASPYSLSDESGNIKYSGRKCILILRSDKLMVINFKTQKPIIEINISGIIGAKQKPQGIGHVLDIFVFDYPRGSCSSCLSSKSRVRQKFSFNFNTSEIDCKNWADTITQQCNRSIESGIRRCRKFLVFVNPVSGQRKALKIWEKIVKPMFQDAGIEVDLCITQRANHARDRVFELDPASVDGVISIGGDGLYYEILNGMVSRENGFELLKSVPLIPIPGGTGNGLVKSILFESGEEYSIENAVFVAIRGEPMPMDLAKVTTMTQQHYSFLILGWGIVSDVDILSEPLRCLGESRLYLAAVYFVLSHRAYKGRLSVYTGKGSASNTLTDMPPLSEPIVAGNGWEVVEADYLLVLVTQTSHCSSSMYSGPGVTMDDGKFTIYTVDNVSRFTMLQLMLSFDNGGHATDPSVKIYKGSAYRLEPLTPAGLFTLDGEVVEYGPIQGIILPGVARVMKLRK